MKQLGITKFIAAFMLLFSTSLMAKSPRLKVNESFFHKCSEKSQVCRVVMKLDHRAFASLADKKMSFDLFNGAIKVFQTRAYKVKKLRRTANPNVVVAVLHVAGEWELSEANKLSVVNSRQKLDVRYIDRPYLSAQQKQWMNFDYEAYKQSAARYQRNHYRPADASLQQQRPAPRQPEYREVGYQHGYAPAYGVPMQQARPEPTQTQNVKNLPTHTYAPAERKPLPANAKDGSSWVEEEDVIFEN